MPHKVYGLSYTLNAMLCLAADTRGACCKGSGSAKPTACLYLSLDANAILTAMAIDGFAETDSCILRYPIPVHATLSHATECKGG